MYDDDSAAKIAESVCGVHETSPRPRCFRCRRRLLDSLSIRIGFGPTCRGKIEQAENAGPGMWNGISRYRLEQLREKYRNRGGR